MRGHLKRFILVLAVLLLPSAAAVGETVRMDSSTQFLWGDDQLSESQSVIAEYLRFGITPEKRPFSLTGYGRVWTDLSDGGLRDDDLSGRLYYLYLDYKMSDLFQMRLGRQFVNLTAGSAVMDGLTADLKKVGPIGATVSAGTDVRYSLDSERSALGDYFLGLGLYLADVRSTRLEASYVRRYDEWDTSREEYGLNFRHFTKFVSPYAELKYDRLSDTIDEATIGADLFPISDLMVKAEYFHYYPTFDSTSIYSVFAVDEFREYLLRAEYSLSTPVTLLASYAFQSYENGDNEDADIYKAGARVYPAKGLTLNANVDHREGFGGKLWGFELFGDYAVKEMLTASAGVQYDSYRRPEEGSDQSAQRYWLGGKWKLNKDTSVIARVESNVNENFKHRTLGRVAINWSL